MPPKEYTGYRTLLKSYISDGLRRDEAEFSRTPMARLIQAPRKRGVPADVLDDAARHFEVA